MPSAVKPAVRCQVERWRDVVDEMAPLFPQHWRELALNQHAITIDLDRELYARLDELEQLHVVTARADGRLVGYVIAFIRTHAHYKSAGLMAMTDMYFLLPEFRHGAGVKMFRRFESSLRAKGCVMAISSFKIHQPHGELFKRLGWDETDHTVVKLLR